MRIRVPVEHIAVGGEGEMPVPCLVAQTAGHGSPAHLDRLGFPPELTKAGYKIGEDPSLGVGPLRRVGQQARFAECSPELVRAYTTFPRPLKTDGETFHAW